MVSLEPQERANRAVRAFADMAPALTLYARAVTGRAVTVRADKITATDGSSILVRPPLVLAETIAHVPLLCGRRDDDGRPRCPACLRSELVYGAVYHEIGHVIAGSTKKGFGRHWALCAERGLDYCAPPTRKRLSLVIEKMMTSSDMMTMYEAAHVLHPYLLPLVRVCDDNMIERRAFAARPGVAGIIHHIARSIMEQGIESEDGTYSRWTDAPPELQMVIALGMEMHGWLREGDFSAEVVEVVRDPLIAELTEREIGDVQDVMAAAVAYLGAFNKLGYLLTEDTVGDEEEGDGSDEGLGEGQGGAGSPGAGGAPGAGGGGDSKPTAGGNGTGGEDAQGGEDAPGDGAQGGKHGEESGDSGGSGDAYPHASDGASQDDGDSGDHQRQEHDERGSRQDAGEPAPGSEPGDRAAAGGDAEKRPRRRAGRPPRVSDVAPEEVDRVAERGIAHQVGHEVMEEGYTESAVSGPGEVTAEQIASAVSQASHFDANSFGVLMVRVDHPSSPERWDVWSDIEQRHHRFPGREALAGSLMRGRKVFSENAFDKHVHGLKRGKLSARSLGARGWRDGEERLFKRTLRHKSADYAVQIGLDVSGSTSSGAIDDIKNAGYLMAELLHQLAVDFSVVAHTTSGFISSPVGRRRRGMLLDLEHYEVKGFGEKWAEPAQRRFAGLVPGNGSFDGHNFEIYRKRLMRQRAQRKLLIYFTDGLIPETNGEEEGPLMERETRLYHAAGIEALIVAVHVSLVNSYGFDQVRMSNSSDLETVIKALEGKLVDGQGAR